PLLGQGAFRVLVTIDNVFTLKKSPRVAPRGKVGWWRSRELHSLKSDFKKLKRRKFASVTGTENRIVVTWQQKQVALGAETSMAANGAIRLINLRDKTTTVLFPSPASKERPNKHTYDSCPGPIGSEGDKFRAHGLYLRSGPNAVHTLYVVHHGDRESIEVFEFDARPKPPTLTWIGCAVAPDPIGLNSVVGLPDGVFITNNVSPGNGDAAAGARLMAGENNGEV